VLKDLKRCVNRVIRLETRALKVDNVRADCGRRKTVTTLEGETVRMEGVKMRLRLSQGR